MAIEISDGGWTPFYAAAYTGHRQVAQLLLDKGADVNAETSDEGQTPLEVAEEKGHKEIVELLRKHGAKE